MSTTPPPGWFPSPDAPGVVRWWDGQQWTDRVSPIGAAAIAQRRSSELPTAGKVALVAAAVGLVGSFLPWASAQSIFGNVDVNGFSAGDGKLTALAAVAALLLGYVGLTNRNRGAVVTALLSSFVGLCVSGYNFSNISDSISTVESQVIPINASVGFGLYMCIAGFVVSIAALIAALSTPANVGRRNRRA